MSLSVESGTDDAKFGGSSGGGSPQHNNRTSSSSSSLHLDLPTIQAYASGMVLYVSSRVTLDTVRPLPMFLGVSGPSFCFSPEAFNPPVKKLDKSTPEKFKSRLRLNFAFFLSNYALVVAGVACVVFLMHPGMLLALAFVWALWSTHYFLISNEVVVAGTNLGTLVSITHRATALAVVTCLVITWKCLVPAIVVVAISGLIIFAHALLRDPKHIDMSSGYRNSGSDDDDEDSGERSHDSEVLVEKPGSV